MVSPVTISEIPTPQEDPQLAREVALFTYRELVERPPSQKDLALQLREMGQRVTVTVIDGAGTILAAGGLASSDDPRTRVIMDVVTAADHREDGLGRDVVGLLVEKAREAKAAAVEVWAFPGSEGFYERLGFQPTGDDLYVKPL